MSFLLTFLWFLFLFFVVVTGFSFPVFVVVFRRGMIT